MAVSAEASTLWSAPLPGVLAELRTSPGGLSEAEALRRWQRLGPNRLGSGGQTGAFSLLLRQFISPIILILLGASLLSFALDSFTDGAIILVIVGVSGLLGFWQEQGAVDPRPAPRRPCGGLQGGWHQ